MADKTEKKYRERDTKLFNISYLVLTVLIILTLGITLSFYKNARSKDTVRFANQTASFQAALENRFGLYTALLKGGRGFIENDSSINREKFAGYVDSLDLENNYKGVQGIGYTKTINAGGRDALIEKIRAEGIADFHIFPEGERSTYQVIIYLEPFDQRNSRAVGFDMASEQIRREAMIRARSTGAVTASGKVLLLQEKGEEKQQNGFLLYLPVYKNGETPDSEQLRAKNLDGFIFSPFRARNFLNEIHQTNSEKDVSIRIYDGDPTEENLLAQTDEPDQKGSLHLGEESYTSSVELNAAGRRWTIVFTTLPAFAEQSNTGWTPLILVSGMSLSFLLFGMTYWEAASRGKLQKTAAELFVVQQANEKLLAEEKTARQTAEQASATKDEFIAVVSHELKTPLNAIAGWTRILKTGDISMQTRELAVQKIEKNLRLQTKIVEQLLGYSEIISGKVSLDEERLIFSEIFTEVCDAFAQQAQEKQIEFASRSDSSETYINGDRRKLIVVMENLLSNALKFTPPGGRIKATLEKRDCCLEMKITDNGRGISEDFLPQIFERYRQADNPNIRDYGGLGLGLTVSDHIVKMHGGTLAASSGGKDAGSIFTVTLPVAD